MGIPKQYLNDVCSLPKISMVYDSYTVAFR